MKQKYRYVAGITAGLLCMVLLGGCSGSSEVVETTIVSENAETESETITEITTISEISPSTEETETEPETIIIGGDSTEETVAETEITSEDESLTETETETEEETEEITETEIETIPNAPLSAPLEVVINDRNYNIRDEQTLAMYKCIDSILTASSPYDKNLSDLTRYSPLLAEKWHAILCYWLAAQSEGFANISVTDGLSTDNRLCLIVLGKELNPDGSMREELIKRLDLALEFAAKYPECYLLVTGGGTAADAPEVTEADAMAAYLRQKGLDESRLIVENKSNCTERNALYTYRKLLEYPQITEIALLTSEYHMSCACTLFYEQFLLTDMDVKIVGNVAIDYVDEAELFPADRQASRILKLYEMNAGLHPADI